MLQKDIFVAIDIETTGLDSRKDKIIEIAAVKFSYDGIIDTFSSLINPLCDFPIEIEHLTGISRKDVINAPLFEQVKDDYKEFLGDGFLVGHNIKFDMNFLHSHDCILKNKVIDTLDLSNIVLSEVSSYSLGSLTRSLNISHSDAHRALGDAKATALLFLDLIKKITNIDQSTSKFINLLSNMTQWDLGKFLINDLLINTKSIKSKETTEEESFFNINIDLPNFKKRREEKNASNHIDEEKTKKKLKNLLVDEKFCNKHIRGYEKRLQQIEMLEKITDAIFERKNLIVEAGTGVGKSLAYLLPAIFYAVNFDKKVVISTNTINLQQQLLEKDFPVAVMLLEELGLIEKSSASVGTLKGSSNYFCLDRWRRIFTSELNSRDAVSLTKMKIWLSETTTGEKSEIILRQNDRFIWERISAEFGAKCDGFSNPRTCFLRSARDRAEFANIVIVNHSLLLSNIKMKGSLLPKFDCLIIDEAHQLENVATNQFGEIFSNRIVQEKLLKVEKMIRTLSMFSNFDKGTEQQRKKLISLIDKSIDLLNENKKDWTYLWQNLGLSLPTRNSLSNINDQILLDNDLISSDDWKQFLTQWHDLMPKIAFVTSSIEDLLEYTSTINRDWSLDLTSSISELESILEDFSDYQGKLDTILGSSSSLNVIWFEKDRFNDDIFIKSAPLDVSNYLEQDLFSQDYPVILTSATLSNAKSFTFIEDRLGFSSEEQLLLDSPFDYKKKTLLLIPHDTVEPTSEKFTQIVSDSIISLSESLEGHVLVLFTAYSLLKKVHAFVKPILESKQISVLAQGIDGSPENICKKFIANSKTLIQGTNSFWEGIDLADGILKAIVFPRLPFNVPTDPVYKKRSDEYEKPFLEYAIPQAILRFRQGFGRLIRKQSDKGLIIILDSRIRTKFYGKLFLNALPDIVVNHDSLNNLGVRSRSWFS